MPSKSENLSSIAKRLDQARRQADADNLPFLRQLIGIALLETMNEIAALDIRSKARRTAGLPQIRSGRLH